MKDSTKFNVVIIEDFELDFKHMLAPLDSLYNVYPDKEEDWQDLRSQIASAYSDDNRISEIRQAKEFIREMFKKFDADLYIIDYLLMEDNDSCNGIRLTEEFIHKKKVLLITKNPNDIDNEVNNIISEFNNSGINGNEIHVMYKQKFTNTFQTKFQTRVKTILPPKKGEKDKPFEFDKI